MAGTLLKSAMLCWVCFIPMFLHAQPVHPTRLVVKLKEQSTNSRKIASVITPGQLQAMPGLSINKLKYGSPSARIRPSKYLDGIYYIDLNEGASLDSALTALQQYTNVEYAEPLYGVSPLAIPNDPAAQPGANQHYLEKIKAYDAWSINTGRPEILIASIDTGIDPNHEDLVDNIYTNTADPVNGIDDDGNGYIDDYQGWDMADNDNNPTADESSHGTKVAGIHSASGNNNVGMAGLCYDCQILPIKIFRSETGISFNSYEAVIYAADMGVDVMNLSWGSTSNYSIFNQDIINYAALEKDVVIVAAAGNTNAQLDFYPASYDNVLSVGFTDTNDQKAPGATYSYNIDLVAPGTGIYTTNNNNRYVNESGSSYAAPIVAGVAALVRDQFPSLSAPQVIEKLRLSTDPIYQIGNNSQYLGRLGSGRLNAQKAVGSDLSPSVRMINVTYQCVGDENCYSGDTILVQGAFVNYLALAENVQATITPSLDDVKILDNSFALGNLAPFDTLKNGLFPIRIVLGNNVPSEAELQLVVRYNGQNYTDIQYLAIPVNNRYYNAHTADLTLTIVNDGSLGYAASGFREGVGFRYQNQPIAQSMGLMVGNSDFVADNVISDLIMATKNQGFRALQSFDFQDQPGVDLYIETIYENITERNLRIEQKTLGWDDLNAIVLEYRIINNSSSNINNLAAGLFVDYDLGFPAENRVKSLAQEKMMVTQDAQSSLFAGTALATNQTTNFAALDIKTQVDQEADLDNIFPDSLKRQILSGGFSKAQAGINNVAAAITGNLSQLAPFSSQKIAFILPVATSESSLIAIKNEAADRYTQFLQNPPILSADTACFNGNATISIASGTTFHFYDDLSLTNLIHTGNDFQIEDITSPKTYFITNMDSSYTGDIRRATVSIDPITADFQTIADTFYLNDQGVVSVNFINNSLGGSQYTWQFGNGLGGTQENPSTLYNNPGTYTVQLTATSSQGCQAQVSKHILVVQRPERPSLVPESFCPGTTVIFNPAEIEQFRLYDIQNPSKLLFSGEELTFQPKADTSFLITRVVAQVESLPATLSFTAYPIVPGFSIQHDTLDLSSDRILQIADQSINADAINWLINGLDYTDRNPNFIWDGQADLNISQILINEEFDCAISQDRIIYPEVSPHPLIQDTIICTTNNISIMLSTQFDPYIFYEDEQAQQILDKGFALKADSLPEQTTIYVSSISELLPSEPVPWTITVESFENEIIAQPDQLVLEDSRQVRFSSIHEDATSWQWWIDGEFVESVPNPMLFFNEPGSYEVVLVSQNDQGCSSTDTLMYNVVEVTAVESNAPAINVYPNPGNERITIAAEYLLKNVRLLTLEGRVLKELSPNQSLVNLDIASLQRGTYILQITGRNNMITTQKLILR